MSSLARLGTFASPVAIREKEREREREKEENKMG